MRRSRGQAVVELAIGSMLLVTIMLFAVYFGEAEHTILKVQEAGAFALWDSTGRRVHDYSNGAVSYGPFNALPTTENLATTARYKDFLGTGTAKTGRQESRVDAQNLQTNCVADPAVTFDVVDPGPGGAGLAALRHQPVFNDMQRYDQPNTGGVSCQANADIRVMHISGYLEDSAGFFKEQHVKRQTMNVCATRWCSGKLSILLGTWAIEGPANHPNNAEEPLFSPGTNGTYRAMVQRLFDDNGKAEGTAATQFATQIAQEPVPYNENTFFMSYRGVEVAGDPYTETIQGLSGHMHPLPTNEPRPYDTNGAPTDVGNAREWQWMTNTQRPAIRERYFLGLPLLRP